MATYTDAESIALTLGAYESDGRTRKKFDANSKPTLTDINALIELYEGVIDQKVRESWSSTTVTDEIHYFSGLIRNISTGVNVASINLNHINITLTKVEYFDNSEWLDITTEEGDAFGDGYFWCHTEEGVIHFTSTLLFPGYSIRVSYTYGNETAPATIKRLCTLLVVIHLLRARELRIVNAELIDEQLLIENYELEINKLYKRHEKLTWM